MNIVPTACWSHSDRVRGTRYYIPLCKPDIKLYQFISICTAGRIDFLSRARHAFHLYSTASLFVHGAQFNILFEKHRAMRSYIEIYYRRWAHYLRFNEFSGVRLVRIFFFFFFEKSPLAHLFYIYFDIIA